MVRERDPLLPCITGIYITVRSGIIILCRPSIHQSQQLPVPEVNIEFVVSKTFTAESQSKDLAFLFCVTKT